MHSAPPVLVPVGRFVWGGRIALVLAVLTAVTSLALAGLQNMAAGQTTLLGLVWLSSAALSWWAWRHERLPPGELAWDGEGWWYTPQDGIHQQVSVTLNWDAGRAMLLRVRCPESSGVRMQYLWLQAKQTRQWHALRCAVYGRDTL